ncbi:MAG: transposase family protein, partial [Gammaproteobacteria bacterium]|nr:transposase family protein [Gammaproteobacteria bacterium]
MDHFGDNKGTNVKVWICLFTCSVIRAIHLEVTEDMTAERFLDAVRRFIARRGKPLEFTSDNALQFKLTNKMFKKFWVKGSISCYPTEHPDILSYVSDQGIKWTFIPEIAPWMGGFYERLVGNVKWALRKSLG